MKTYRTGLMILLAWTWAGVTLLTTPAHAQTDLPDACYTNAATLYACQNGYRPQPATPSRQVCTSRLDYFYACQNGWRP